MTRSEMTLECARRARGVGVFGIRRFRRMTFVAVALVAILAASPVLEVQNGEASPEATRDLYLGSASLVAELRPARQGISASAPIEGFMSVVPAGSAPATQASPGSLSVVVKSAFDGLGRQESGDVRPPDPQVAAGTYEVVEIVNYAVEPFDKQGNRLWTPPMTLEEFFGSQDTMYDPRILFDRASARWFVSAAQYNDSADRRTPTPVKIAVSLSENLTEGWRIYDIVGRGNPDQPFTGYNDGTFAVTWNAYSLSRDRWMGTEYALLNKAQMIAGVPNPAAIYDNPDNSVLGLQPVESLGATPILYMVGRAWKTGTEIQYYAVSGVPGVSPVSVTKVLVPIRVNLGSTDAEQPTTDIDLDTNRGRVRVVDAAWSQDRLWFAVNSRCKPPDDSLNRSCLRITEIDTSTPSAPRVTQEFDHSETGRDLFYAALSMDNRGNLGVLYGFSSETDFPSLAVTGQSTTDGPNALKAPVTIVVSTAVDAVPEDWPYNNSNRYGDYFGAGTDPVDPSLLWVVGEYQPTPAWGTYLASFRIEDFALSADPASVSVVQGSNATSTIGVTSLGGFTRPVSLSASASPSGPGVSLSATSVTPPPGAVASVTLMFSTEPATPTGLYLVTVTGSSGVLSASATILAEVLASGGGGGGGSVAFGTSITREDGTDAPVQNLHVGDRLLGYDTETGTFTVSVITAIQVVDTSNMLVINTEAGAPLRVDANPHQTLWVRSADGTVGWKPVTEIVLGDSLFTLAGWVQVTSVEFAREGRHVMFDIIATMPYFASGYLDPPIKQ